MKTILKNASCFMLLLTAGCFTLKQSEMPTVKMTSLAEGKEVKVAVTGFAATVSAYIPVYGHQTMYVDHGPGGYASRHRMWHGGYYETMTTETLVPQVSATDAYLRRAQMLMEDAGFLLRAPKADYTVEVNFEGPFVTDGERGVEFAWMFLSVLSAEYTTQTWQAKLRIYDTQTGKTLFRKDYSQKYEDCVWSPIFFIGLAGYTQNTPNYIQNWCLSVLTDQTIADATAFLVNAGTVK